MNKIINLEIIEQVYTKLVSEQVCLIMARSTAAKIIEGSIVRQAKSQVSWSWLMSRVE